MIKLLSRNFWNFFSIIVLALVVLGFFYFETSTLLRIFVVTLGFISLISVRKNPEIFALFNLYLLFYDLYNVRYGLAFPLSIIILIVFGFTLAIFAFLVHFYKISKNLDKNLLWLYLAIAGLSVMEIFLAMSFWPVDPKIKSFVIVIIFYVIFRIFYLYANNVLNSKKVIVFMLISFFILAVVLTLNLFFGI